MYIIPPVIEYSIVILLFEYHLLLLLEGSQYKTVHGHNNNQTDIPFKHSVTSLAHREIGGRHEKKTVRDMRLCSPDIFEWVFGACVPVRGRLE